MCFNHFDFWLLELLVASKLPLPECSKLICNKRNLLLTTHIQISAGNSPRQPFSSRDIKKKLNIFSSEHRVPALGIAGKDVTTNVLLIALPTQGEFIISHKALSIQKVI